MCGNDFLNFLIPKGKELVDGTCQDYKKKSISLELLMTIILVSFTLLLIIIAVFLAFYCQGSRTTLSVDGNDSLIKFGQVLEVISDEKYIAVN